MKLIKSISAAVLILFGLTGCYTQLQFSEQGNRGYAYDSDEYYDDEEYYDSYDDDYIPVYYKDYQTANWWNACGCNPYGYGSYNSYYPSFGFYGYNNYYRPYYASNFYSPYYAFGSPYFYRSGFHFGISFSFGFSPFLYSSFYSPFSPHPFYAPFYGYRPFISYNTFYYNTYYNDYDSNRHYGRRRGIGSSRLGVGNATRVRHRGGSAVRGKSDDRTYRRRVRSRDSGSRGRVERGRTRSGSTGNGRVGSSDRTRSRDNGRVESSGRTRSGDGMVQRSRIEEERERDARAVRSRKIERRGEQLRERRQPERISRTGLIDATRQYRRSVRNFERERNDTRTERNIRVRSRNRSSSSFWDGLKSLFNTSSKGYNNTRIRSTQPRTRSNPVIRSRPARTQSTGSSVQTRSRTRSSSDDGRTRSRSRDNN